VSAGRIGVVYAAGLRGDKPVFDSLTHTQLDQRHEPTAGQFGVRPFVRRALKKFIISGEMVV